MEIPLMSFNHLPTSTESLHALHFQQRVSQWGHLAGYRPALIRLDQDLETHSKVEMTLISQSEAALLRTFELKPGLTALSS